MLKDGHQSINRDLYNHHKYSHYGMDDHKPYTVFWPWHIWGSHLKDIDGLKPATSETWHGNLYDSAHHWRLERNSLLWNWGFSVGIIHDMIYIWHNYMMFLMHCCIYISYYIILYHIWYSYLYMFSGRNFGLGSKSQKDRIILRDQKTSLDVLIARCFLVCIYIIYG